MPKSGRGCAMAAFGIFRMADVPESGTEVIPMATAAVAAIGAWLGHIFG
jgi:hypothetical protein